MSPCRVVVPLPADCFRLAEVIVENAVTFLALSMTMSPNSLPAPAPTVPLKVISLPAKSFKLLALSLSNVLAKVILPAPKPVLSFVSPTRVTAPLNRMSPFEVVIVPDKSVWSALIVTVRNTKLSSPANLASWPPMTKSLWPSPMIKFVSFSMLPTSPLKKAWPLPGERVSWCPPFSGPVKMMLPPLVLSSISLRNHTLLPMVRSEPSVVMFALRLVVAALRVTEA